MCKRQSLTMFKWQGFGLCIREFVSIRDQVAMWLSETEFLCVLDSVCKRLGVYVAIRYYASKIQSVVTCANNRAQVCKRMGAYVSISDRDYVCKGQSVGIATRYRVHLCKRMSEYVSIRDRDYVCRVCVRYIRDVVLV